MAAEPKRRSMKLSPVMQQYLTIKGDHEDAILFFRMGDFYEMFFEDAERAAEILDITLTSRNRNDPDPIPMCGVPFHSMRPYVARLLEAGRRVAICEQVELPQQGEKIARRAVTRIVTPGTTLDEETLVPERSNYLASVAAFDDGAARSWGLAITDFSTGEARATEFDGTAALLDELVATAPSEVVLPAGTDSDTVELVRESLPGCMVDIVGAGDVVPDALPSAAGRAWACLFGYVERTQGGRTAHLRAPSYYEAGAFLKLDNATRRNLELLESYGGGVKGSLVSVLDRSATAMGKRLMRRWVVQPLADLDAIGRRLDAVECLVEGYEFRQQLREALKKIGDLERLAGRLGSASAGPRDVRRLADALDGVEAVATMIGDFTDRGPLGGALVDRAAALEALPEVRERIRTTLTDEPPPLGGKGPIIRDGFHEEIDRLRTVSRDGKGWIAAFEADERERTGISTLKVGFNRVFGYFIEISRANQRLVPEGYERKQTLANAERYITEDLKKREVEVLGAEERLGSLEGHLFGELVAALAVHQQSLGSTAAALAVVDALSGLAETAHHSGYVRPEFHEGAELDLVGARHPVVEAGLSGRFVSNDCRLGPESRTVMVITGPNMAGKSTYLRQVALVTLLAHCGSFVPATSARVPLVDRIFTRIGASDNLAAGQSTFMVEMSETADILANMTERSLVVLDEIGRGTSTFDGISIAWAVAEAMVRAGTKTLFATHYHELAGLASEHDAVENFSVSVRRYKGDIVFLFRVVAGPTSGSYGIEVARLAGVPDEVIEKARTILASFESGEGVAGLSDHAQLTLFSNAPQPTADVATAEATELVERIAAVDAETLSPLEALNLLADLVARAKEAR